jgi:hypothetical protein
MLRIGKTQENIQRNFPNPNFKNLPVYYAHRIIILPAVFLNGCETWSLTLRKERRLRFFENLVLWRIFGLNTDEVTGHGEDYITRNFMLCTPHQI